MADPEPSVPRPPREQQALDEVGRTEVSPVLARTIALAFLVLLFGVPAAAHARWLRAWWSGGAAAPYREWAGTGAGILRAAQRAYGLDLVLRPNAVLRERIDAFEDAFDEDLFLTRWSTGPVQSLLCRLGVGNEEAYVGDGDWLFFRPAVTALTGPPFLDPARLAQRRRDEGVAPDPRPAIRALHAALAERGIVLVLLPVPGKAGVHPERFAGVPAGGPLRRNSSFPAWLEQLRGEGIDVVDPGPRIRALREAGGVAYLRTDTHWRPEVMEAVAADLADHLRERHPDALAGTDPVAWRRGEARATHVGDIAVMLRLPEDQALYPPETVRIRPVVDAAGRPWEPRSGGPVLLLGDSFANIYSQAALGWGTHAGLAEQLACELGLPLDRIALNADGAHATRLRLAQSAGVLDGVRVVVWEFAARELAVGHWPVLPLPARAAGSDGPERTPGTLSVTGTVAAVSGRPQTGADYADFVMKLHLEGVRVTAGSGTVADEAVVHVLAMREREILPVARIAVGQTPAFVVVPWDKRDDQELDDPYHGFEAGLFDDMMLELRTDLDRFWALPGKEEP